MWLSSLIRHTLTVTLSLGNNGQGCTQPLRFYQCGLPQPAAVRPRPYTEVAGCLMRVAIACSGTGEISTDTAITMGTSCYIMPPKNSAVRARELSHWLIMHPATRLYNLSPLTPPIFTHFWVPEYLGPYPWCMCTHVTHSQPTCPLHTPATIMSAAILAPQRHPRP